MPNGSLSYREWAIDMASFFVAPYIPLLFTPIPFSATLEIMSIFLLGLVVIIPTIMGGWNEFSDTRTLELTDYDSGWCPEIKEACILWYRKFIITSSAFSSLFSLPSITKSLFLQRLLVFEPSGVSVCAHHNHYDRELLCREIQQEELHPKKARSGGCSFFASAHHCSYSY